MFKLKSKTNKQTKKNPNDCKWTPGLFNQSRHCLVSVSVWTCYYLSWEGVVKPQFSWDGPVCVVLYSVHVRVFHCTTKVVKLQLQAWSFLHSKYSNHFHIITHIVHLIMWFAFKSKRLILNTLFGLDPVTPIGLRRSSRPWGTGQRFRAILLATRVWV